jgi:hypothetical protein
MRQEEALNGTVEHDNLYQGVTLERGDRLVQLWNGFRAKDVQRRVVKRNPPVER